MIVVRMGLNHFHGVGLYYNIDMILVCVLYWQEVEGNKALVGNATQFWWFGHLYNHQQPHLLTDDRLQRYMVENWEFAKVYTDTLTESEGLHAAVFSVMVVVWTSFLWL